MRKQFTYTVRIWDPRGPLPPKDIKPALIESALPEYARVRYADYFAKLDVKVARLHQDRQAFARWIGS